MPFTDARPKLWYDRSGTGPPLLLITGFTISSAVFDPVLELYEPHFDCIRYDNRGSGRSDSPMRPTSIPELAHDAIRLLDELGVESAHVYGISMGGMVAQEMAIRFPDRVRGLVLGATTPGGPRAVLPAPGELATLAAGMVGAVRQAGRPVLGAALFSPEFRRDEPERALELIEYFGRHVARPHGMAAHWWASFFHDTVSRLGNIQAPTLVMHGGRDAMDPVGNAHLLAERIPAAELAIVPGAGHAYPLECPGESFDVFMSWIQRHEPIAPGRSITGLTRRTEPLTRALGLPVGTLRTGRSLVDVATRRLGRTRGRVGSAR